MNNSGIGLFRLRNWQNSTVVKTLSDRILKVFGWETYRDNFNAYRECYNVFINLDSSHSYGKIRLIQERQKQSYADKLLNNFVNTCQKKTGYDDFVVAYEDGNVGLIVKGMDNGGSAHRPLMIRL